MSSRYPEYYRHRAKGYLSKWALDQDHLGVAFHQFSGEGLSARSLLTRVREWNIQRQGTYQIGEARPFTESIRKSWAEGANQQSWNGVTQQRLHLSLTREESHEF